MKEVIPLDDPKYDNKHVDLIGGWSWYILLTLLLFAWVATFGRMVIVGEFSLWPLTFFVGAVVCASKIGVKLRENGYIHAKERKELLDAKKKDRENA